jgi:NifB/MoaA-like Fe-S oxidoreductase
VRDIGHKIERTKAELRTVKPRSRRRVELELLLRDLMLILLRRENRAARKRAA